MIRHKWLCDGLSDKASETQKLLSYMVYFVKIDFSDLKTLYLMDYIKRLAKK